MLREQDESGTWWEIRRGKRFTRLSVGKCQRCGAPAFQRPSQPRLFCSHACAQKDKPKRELSPTWRGGRSRDIEGYIWINVGPEFPGAVRRGNIWVIKEHRKVMAETLGRPLTRSENVHHLNGVRDDNRPENLELWKRAQPSGVRLSDYHCPGCRCEAT